MHFLHKILVHIPDITNTSDEMNRKELLQQIRLYADSATEDFYQQAYDWRETESAGRWSAEYPQQVYLAAEDTEWFIKELQWIMDTQREDINACMEQLRATVGTDLEKVIDTIWEYDPYGEQGNGVGMMLPYYLHNIACHLHGNYRCDSYFYNANQYTARIYKSDIEKVRQEPEKWALVMFDYHN